jgi:DNA primase
MKKGAKKVSAKDICLDVARLPVKSVHLDNNVVYALGYSDKPVEEITLKDINAGNDELLKIYNSFKEKKFIKVRNHLQGYDQLTFKTKYLLIVSSLKDLMAFERLGIKNIEAVAPDSENSMISKPIMQQLISSYTKIIVLFDNDDPGKKSAKNYNILYGIDNVNLDLSKDLSDSVKEHGITKVRSLIYELLKQVI